MTSSFRLQLGINTSSIGATDLIAQGFNPGIRWDRISNSSLGTTDLLARKCHGISDGHLMI